MQERNLKSNKSSNTITGKRIEIIQVLRLMAAAMVILYHCHLVGEIAFFGVDLFFVISGYVMVLITEKPGGRQQFLRRRLIRIFPLYWLLTVLFYGIILVRPESSIMSVAKPEYLFKSMLCIPFVNERGYAVPILGAGWTVQYEVVFYLVFAAAWRVGHRCRTLTASLFLAALVLAAAFLPLPFEIRYYGDPIVLDFVWGMAAFYLVRRLGSLHLRRDEAVGDSEQIICDETSDKIPDRRSGSHVGNRVEIQVRIRAFIGLLVSIVWLLVFAPSFPSVPRTVRLGIPAAVFLASCILLWGNISFPKILVELGNATYSIYLVEYFTTAAYNVAAAHASLPVRIAGFVGILVITLAVSYGSYRLVEVKFTGFLKRVLHIQ